MVLHSMDSPCDHRAVTLLIVLADDDAIKPMTTGKHEVIAEIYAPASDIGRKRKKYMLALSTAKA
jgi:hypothetical protein